MQKPGSRVCSAPLRAALRPGHESGNARRAIDIYEGDKINETAVKVLVRAAVAVNVEKAGSQRRKKSG